MWKQIRLLLGIQLHNAFGINEMRFGHERKRRNRAVALGVTFLFLGALIVFYIGAMSWLCIQAGIAGVLPAFLAALISLIILFFTMYRAGGTIFNMKSYENTIVLPVRPAAIILSRFLTLYLANAAMSLLVLAPAAVVCGWMLRPGPVYLLLLLLGAAFLPLIPMTVATALGALIYAAASRMRHKNLVVILLSALLTVGMVALSMGLSYGGAEMTETQMTRLLSAVLSRIGRLYPPAILFSNGVVNGNVRDYLLLAVLSIALLAALIFLVQRKFTAICTALHASTAKRNFVMREQAQSTPGKALYRKELGRYFASSIYVLNTSIGYILMVVLSIAILAVGPEKLEESMGMGGLLEKYLPLILAFLCVLSPSTTSAVSMEGKQWWIVRSLPVDTKTILDSKLLVNWTVALPCYAVSEVLLCAALPLSAMERLWLLLLPLFYILFSAVLGLSVNLRMPMLNWESETTVVKQSGAVLVSMLLSFLSVGAPLLLSLFLVPDGWKNPFFAVVAVILLSATLFLYRSNNRISLQNIN